MPTLLFSSTLFDEPMSGHGHQCAQIILFNTYQKISILRICPANKHSDQALGMLVLIACATNEGTSFIFC